ncbi:PHP-associated domain-containing protein [Haloferacaceae archaeon DSL9]
MYAVDLHAHTRFFHVGPGKATPYDPIGLRLNALVARARGLDAVASTNHDYAYAPGATLPVDVLPGIEVSSSDGHVLVVGPNPPERTTPGSMTAAEVVDDAHDRGCAAIMAHPFRNSDARNTDADFDAVEINGKNPGHTARTVRLAAERGLPLVGGSDAHYPIEIGRAFTRVDVENPTAAAIADAIRSGDVTAMRHTSRFSRALGQLYTAIHRGKGWLPEAVDEPIPTMDERDERRDP